MRNDDALAQLRAVNPVSEKDLSPVSSGALVALREGITMTSPHGSTDHGSTRRVGRRGLTGAVVTVALLGGGAAYAVHETWSGNGLADTLTCVTQWSDPNRPGLVSTGGGAMTGDPIADCQRYQAESGLAPIENPVAFRLGDMAMIYVAPRSQMPADADELVVTAEGEALYELEASTYDVVDGLGSRCLPESEALVFAQAELDRLGLAGWTVASGPAGDQACARVSLDRERSELVVSAHDRDDIDALKGDGIEPWAFDVRDALRTGFADVCLSVPEAQTVATAAVGDNPHGPTAWIDDPTASCTRVDMLVGGDIAITLRGPAAATP